MRRNHTGTSERKTSSPRPIPFNELIRCHDISDSGIRELRTRNTLRKHFIRNGHGHPMLNGRRSCRLQNPAKASRLKFPSTLLSVSCRVTVPVNSLGGDDCLFEPLAPFLPMFSTVELKVTRGKK